MTYQRLNVLVLEDNQDVSDIIKEFFDQKIYNIICHESAELALEKVQEQTYDLLVCDLNLPQMNGIQFVKILESLKKMPKRVLFLSGHLHEFEDDLAYLNRFAFYEKPLFFNELESLVDSMTKEFLQTNSVK